MIISTHLYVLLKLTMHIQSPTKGDEQFSALMVYEHLFYKYKKNLSLCVWCVCVRTHTQVPVHVCIEVRGWPRCAPPSFTTVYLGTGILIGAYCPSEALWHEIPGPLHYHLPQHGCIWLLWGFWGSLCWGSHLHSKLAPTHCRLLFCSI